MRDNRNEAAPYGSNFGTFTSKNSYSRYSRGSAKLTIATSFSSEFVVLKRPRDRAASA